MTQEPIDAVITWVDGNDPVLRKKREKYLTDPSIAGAASTRFASVDEVLYCVLSILKHALFFRKIYIVTDEQTPPIFEVVKKHFPDQLDKIEIVDHTVIFRGYEKFLPTFNSMTITMQLHNIPGLAEKFVFFNDDFFLVRDVTPEDFFAGTAPVMRGGFMGRSLNLIESLKEALYILRRVPEAQRRLSSKKWMLKAAKLAGVMGKTFIATHAPYPIRKSTISRYASKHPEIWNENLKYRFRHSDQFVYESLAAHLEIRQKNACIKGRSVLTYIRVSGVNDKKIIRKLTQTENDPNIKFLCIQNLDQASSEMQKEIQDWLTRHVI